MIKMAKVGRIVGLIFTIAFTIIMANYTYHAWVEMKAAEKDVQIAQQELQTTQDDYSDAKTAFINEYEVAGNGGVVGSK